MAFPEGNKLFAGDLRANLDERNADMVQFTKRWNWKGLSNIKDTFAECLQLQISVLQQSMWAPVCASSRLVSQAIK